MTETYIGLLSGTSMDAIDVATVAFAKDGSVQLNKALNVPLPNDYKTTYLQIIQDGSCSINTLGELDQWTAELFANAVLKFLDHYQIPKETIKAIGSHGQTIWHAPTAKRPFTLQLGNPHVIAYKTGITTVADFRRSDMAAGGQGAPLAPLFHRAVFSNNEPICVVNIGGLSNVTILHNEHILGFDTGPGNCLLDLITKKYFNVEYDKDGLLAKVGTVDQIVLQHFLADPYFAASPPKSTGREYFNEQWLGAITIQPQDLLATLAQLTAQTIADAIRNYAPPNSKVFLCGGGAHNTYLRNLLATALERDVKTTQELGIEPDWVEAALFAWLAKMAINKQSIDSRRVTGAKDLVIAGSVIHIL